MEKPIVEKLREFTNGFEHYTFETSQHYADECEDESDLIQSIDDNLTIAERDWDTKQVWDYDDNNDLIIGTIVDYDKEGDEPLIDAFCRILIPDSWK